MNIKGGGRVPVPPAGAGTLVKLVVLGGTAVYAAVNSLYNVEGGHRAIVFNRLEGIKDKVTHRSKPRVLVNLRCDVMAPMGFREAMRVLVIWWVAFE
jgi:prohibitin 2